MKKPSPNPPTAMNTFKSILLFPLACLLIWSLLSANTYGQVSIGNPQIRSGFDGTDITNSMAPGSAIEYGYGEISNNGFFDVDVPYLFKLDGVVIKSGTTFVPRGATASSTFRVIPPVVLTAGNHTIALTDSAGVGPVRNFVVGAGGLPVVTITASDAAASEAGPGTGAFLVSRTGSTAASLNVVVSRTGTAAAGDFTGIPGSVVIPVGQASVTVTVTPVDDALVESSETVVLTISPNAAYTVGAPSTATVTIADNDLPVVTITATDATATEAGQTAGLVTVSRTGATGALLTVLVTTTGSATETSDYTTLGGMIVIPAGQASTAALITPVDDLQSEASETVVVTIAASAAYTVGAASSATVTITDNDLPTVDIVATDANATEAGATTGLLTLTRSGATASPLTVFLATSGTATPVSDYTALPASVTIPAGQTTAAVLLTPVDDATSESDETVVVTISANAAYAVGATGSAAVVISDNDAQSLVVSTNAVTVPEGTGSATFTVRLSAQPSGSVVVDVARTAGDADISAAPAALTFTTANWNTPQTVTLSAAQDADTTNGSATITVSSAGLTSQTLTATEQDDDTGSISPLTTPFRPSDLPGGLQGYWKFDGNTTDASPNGYHLTNVGTPSYVEDDYWATSEQSGNQSGANYWSIPDANCPNLALPGTAFTMGAWIKMDGVAWPGNFIVSKWASNAGYQFSVGASGYLGITIQGTGVSTPVPVLSAGKWHHVIFVYDKTRSMAIFYVDGNLVHSQSHSIDLTDNAEPFDVGYIYPGGFPSLSLKGAIKDLAVWNRALTPIEVKSLALGVDLQTLAYRPDDVSVPPTAWWKLNEISSLSAVVTRLDSSGSHHLTDNSNLIGSAGGYVEGTGARFAGNPQFLSGPPSQDYAFGTGDYTISHWIKFATITPQPCWLGIGRLQVPTHGISFTLLNGSQLYVYTQAGPQTWNWIPVANTWYHVALKRSGTTLTAYIDGVSLGARTSSESVTNTEGLFIGRDSLQAVHPFDGTAQDVAIWKSYALSDTELKALATGLPVQRSGIVSYWNLDEPNGPRRDIIGSNDLTPGATGAGSGAGKVGGAVQFTSANQQFLSIADTVQNGLDIADDISVLYWGKLNSASNQAVIYKRDVVNNGWGAAIADGTKMTFDVNATSRVVASPQTLTSFFHSCLTFDGAGSRAFFNSALNNSTPSTAQANDNSQPFYMGSLGGNQLFFDGLVDEVVVAQRWFREEEIKTIYNKGLTGQAITSQAAELFIPEVTLTVADGTAAEAGPDAGAFTVSRTGSLAAALTVGLTVGGTATPGSDYAPLPASITIPAGQASGAVTVLPIREILIEGNETVTLTLQAGAGFNLGTPSQGTVTIADSLPLLLRTEISGMGGEIGMDVPPVPGGWTPDQRLGSLYLNAADTEVTVRTAPIDLSAAGQVYLTMQLLCLETSLSSNFEPEDQLCVAVQLTGPGGVGSIVSLIPTELDVNRDGCLSGEEFNPAARPPAEQIYLHRQLTVTIPADANSARLVVTGFNDSGSETFAIGGVLLSDVPPGSDADRDGIAREPEMFAQTHPADAASVLRSISALRTVAPGTGNRTYSVTHTAVAGVRYLLERSSNGQQWIYTDLLRAAATGPNQIDAFLTPAQDAAGKLFFRVRAVP